MNLKKFVTDIGTSLGRQVMMLVRGIILVPLITKLIGPESYGIWATVLGVVSIASGVGSLDLSNALIRYTPEEDASGQTFVDLLLIVSVTSTVTVGAFFLLERLVGLGIGEDGRMILAAATLILVRCFGQVVRGYPQARNQIKVFEALNTAQIVGEVIALSVVLFVLRDIVAGLWALAAVAVVIDAATLLYYRPSTVNRPSIHRIRKYVTYSLPMVAQTLSSRLIRHADKYLILYFISPTVAGVYAICTSMGKVIEDLGQTLNPTLYPTVVKAWRQDDIETLTRVYTTIFRWFTILGIPAVAGLGILAEPLLATISTTSIADQGQYLLPITAAAFLVAGFNSPLQFVVNAAERNELLSNSYLVAAGLNLVLNYALIPPYGIYGAAAATTASYGLITAYLFYWARTQIPFSFSVVTISKSLAVTAVMTAALLAIPSVLSYPVRLVIYPLVGISIYIPLMVAIGGIDRREIAEVKAIMAE